MAFKLDWATGQSRLTHILTRTPLMGRQLSQKWEGIDLTAPATPEPKFNQFDVVFSNRLLPAPGLSVTTGGHRYLFNRVVRADQPAWTVIWRWDEGKDDFAIPVAIIASTGAMFSERGEGQIFDQADFKDAIRAEKAKHEANQFIWSDRNNDQKMQPDELQFHQSPGGPGGLFGIYLDADLSFAGGNVTGGRYPAPSLDANGVPTWDLSKITSLGNVDPALWNGQSGPPLLGREFTVVGAGGWEYFSPPQGYRKDGTLAWLYRYYDHWRLPQFPGQLVAGAGSMGRMVTPRRKDITPNPAYRPISLGIGEPKHPTPELILQAWSGHPKGLASYPATAGEPALRASISAWMARRYDLAVDPKTQVLPVNGSREALFALAQTVIDPTRANATVVCPNPFYQIYEGAALLAGAQTFFVNSDPKRNFAADWKPGPREP